MAKWIAMMGGTVIVACRSEDKAMEVQISNSHFERISSCNLDLLVLQDGTSIGC